MLITSKNPSNWNDLQEDVATILRQCGFLAETNKTVPIARGSIDLDVFAKENVKGRENIYIFECKYWKRKVPKSIVHSFRSVVNDLGCNFGYIITKNGFQKGAIEASGFSSIKLLTWEEFQNEFFNSWYENYFIKEFRKTTDKMWRNCEIFLPEWALKASRADIIKLKKIRRKYCPLEMFVSSEILMKYNFYLNNEVIGANESDKILQLPIDVLKARRSDVKEIFKIETHNEFLEAIKDFLKEGAIEFSKIRLKIEA